MKTRTTYCGSPTGRWMRYGRTPDSWRNAENRSNSAFHQARPEGSDSPEAVAGPERLLPEIEQAHGNLR